MPGVTFAVETHDRGFAGEPDYPQGMDAAGVVIGVLDEIVGDDVVKLLVRHRDLDRTARWAARGGGRNRRVHPFQQIGAARDRASGVTKAATLARMAARHGIGPDHIAPSNDEDVAQVIETLLA